MEVVIPSSCTSIYGDAFVGSDSIESVWCYADIPPVVYADFFNVSAYSKATLYVPEGSEEAYKSADYWTKFKNINNGGMTPVMKCAKPSIAYEDGRLYYESATPGATIRHTITCDEINTSEGTETLLTATYHISAYAMRAGYENSDVAYATLVWANATFIPGEETDVKQVKVEFTPLLIIQNGGVLTVSGAEDGEVISAYALNGAKICSSLVTDGDAKLDLSSNSGEIVILNVNGKSAKFLIK